MREILLRLRQSSVRPAEAAALLVVSIITLLGFTSVTAAQLLQQKQNPLQAVDFALLPAGLIIFSFIALNVLLRLRGLESEQLILPCVALLFALGSIMIWRLRGGDGILQQLRAYWIGLALMGGFILFPRWVEHARRWAILIALLGLALPFVTAIFGVPDETGARLSLKLGPLPALQVTEFIKLALVVFLAWYADRSGRMVEGRARMIFGWLRLPPIHYFIPGVAFVLIATLALVLMADFGAVIIMLFIFTGMLYAAFETRIFATLAAIGAFLAAGAGLLLSVAWRVPDHIRDRFLAFQNPWSSAPLIVNGQPSGITISQGPGYQIQQALYAAIAGGFSGRGLGFGTPQFIPLAHSDFIFAALLEEMGAVVGLAVLAVFAILLLRILRLAAMLPQGQVFERLLLVGIGLHLIAQVLVMVGGTLNIIPMTGVTVPFMSQGGTALMVNLAEVGMTLALAQRLEG